MKRRVTIAISDARGDCAVEVEANTEGFVRRLGATWMTVDELALELETEAQRSHGYAARRDHRDIGRELAGLVWDLNNSPPATRRTPSE
jgi:hypothetical protein